MYGNYCRANTIDAIKTKKDLIEFIGSNHVRKYPDRINLLFDSDTLHSAFIDTNKSFYKMDIDGNGKTDIIISGGSVIIMHLDSGYIAYIIDVMGFLWGIPYSFEKAIYLDDHTTVLLYIHPQHMELGIYYRDSSIVHDTLIFKFNNFINYHQQQMRPKIKRIIFWDHSACYGDCSETYVEINKNGAAIYNHRPDGVKDSISVLVNVFDYKQVRELWNLLVCIDMMSLSDNYSINSHHENTAMLNIYFDDGTVKKIHDYGFSGTLGLRAVYNKLYDLKQSTGWQEWQYANWEADNNLVQSPIAFDEWWGGENYKDTVLSNVGAGKSYVGVRPYCGLINTFITLFPDHRFLLVSPKQNRCHIENIISLGKWQEVGDSAIVLNWDGISTLAAARDKEKCKQYFSNNNLPRPTRIDNLRLGYSKGKRNLKLLRDKQHESIFREY